MSEIPLSEFIRQHRSDLLRRCAEKTSDASRSPSNIARERGIPVFLDQLVTELATHARIDGADMEASAIQHGRDLHTEGFTVGQLVHDYGALCQSITDLAVEMGARVSSDDFRVLNRCLDGAIASAVTEFATQEKTVNGSEALQLRNLVYMAVRSFDPIRSGKVGAAGATGDVLQRSLSALNDLVKDRTA